jgi:NADH-quinone oxidoreductase subunit E
MTGDGDQGKDPKAAENPSLGFTLPFADSAPANPMEMMAAATAAGMAVTAQFANLFFGMMQAAMEATSTRAETGSPKPAAAEGPAPSESSPKAAPEAPAANAAPKVKPVKTKPIKARSVKAGLDTQVAAPKTPPVAERADEKRKPRRSQKAADDLKKISGIGPKLESLLNGMDVRLYRDIAAWSDKDVEHFDRELGLDGRIAKDNWIAQAKALLR